MLTLFRARLHVGLSHSRSGRFGATSASQCQHLSALLPVEQNAAATCSYGQTPQTRTSSSPRGSPQRKMGPEPRLRQCEGLRTFHTSPPTPRRGGRVRCRPVARGSGPFRLSAKRPKSGPVNTVAERNSESNRCRRNSTLRSANSQPSISNSASGAISDARALNAPLVASRGSRVGSWFISDVVTRSAIEHTESMER